MPRRARQESQSGIYHVFQQGIGSAPLFAEKKDRQKYLEILGSCQEKTGAVLLAYCLLPDHVHLLIRQGEKSIGNTMKSIGITYAAWYNVKYQRVGPLFRDRYRSDPVESDAYLVRLIRYIHQEPVKEGLCGRPEDYAYSSYRGYFYDPLIDHRIAEMLIGQDQFADFHAWRENLECEDTCGTIRKRVTDEQAKKLFRKAADADSPEEFYALPQEKKEKAVKKMLAGGASLRQTGNITGLSLAMVRKYGASADRKEKK